MEPRNSSTSLNRFLEAQESSYHAALSEIRAGKKRSHWMWYIFPQIAGLGFSAASKYYAVTDLEEAGQYLSHPDLGKRLIEISRALLNLKASDAHEIFGSPDDVKLKSSMTLFSSVPGADPVFRQVLNKYFRGEPDQRTLDCLKN